MSSLQQTTLDATNAQGAATMGPQPKAASKYKATTRIVAKTPVETVAASPLGVILHASVAVAYDASLRER